MHQWFIRRHSTKDESKDAGQTEDKSEQNKLLQIINKIAKILTINVSMLRHLHVDARENGVNLSEVSGKGNDVLRKDDVDNSQNKQVNQLKVKANHKTVVLKI